MVLVDDYTNVCQALYVSTKLNKKGAYGITGSNKRKASGKTIGSLQGKAKTGNCGKATRENKKTTVRLGILDGRAAEQNNGRPRLGLPVAEELAGFSGNASLVGRQGKL